MNPKNKHALLVCVLFKLCNVVSVKFYQNHVLPSDQNEGNVTLTRLPHKCVAISYSTDQMLSAVWNIHEPYIRRLGRYWKPFSRKLNVLVTNSVTALSLPQVYSYSLTIFIPCSTLFLFTLRSKKYNLFMLKYIEWT